MGQVTTVARISSFWVKNLDAFVLPLREYEYAGEYNSDIHCLYSDYRKRNRKALIDMSTHNFSEIVLKKGEEEETLDLYSHIQMHLLTGEICTVHLVSYEHAADMSIEKIVITESSIERTTLVE